MLMLIESIWALMVFSAEMNAEVNKTSLFWLQNSGIWGCFVLLKWMRKCETTKTWSTEGLSWWFQFCRVQNVFPMKSCLWLQMKLVINLLKQIWNAEWKGRSWNVLCSLPPLPAAYRKGTFVKVHFSHFWDTGLETPKLQGGNIN